MTKEEFLKYTELENIFVKDCERICRELSRYNKDFSGLNIFRFDGYGRGVICESSLPDSGYQFFSADFLTFSEQEMALYVDNLIKERDKEKEEERETMLNLWRQL